MRRRACNRVWKSRNIAHGILCERKWALAHDTQFCYVCVNQCGFIMMPWVLCCVLTSIKLNCSHDCWCIMVCKYEGQPEQMLTRHGAYGVQEGPWIQGHLMQPWLPLIDPGCEHAKKEDLRLCHRICRWWYAEYWCNFSFLGLFFLFLSVPINDAKANVIKSRCLCCYLFNRTATDVGCFGKH